MTTINGTSTVLAPNTATPASVATVKTASAATPTPPAPTISSTNSSSVQVSKAGMSVVRTLVTRAAVPMTVAQVLAATSISAQTTIKDTAANIQANLGKLAALPDFNNISSITLSDTKAPIISMARSDVPGELNSSANTNGVVTLLKKITSSYTLNVTGLTVADALTLKSPNATTALSMSINATAEQIANNATALQTLAKAKSIASITVADTNAARPISRSPSLQRNSRPTLNYWQHSKEIMT